MKPSPPVTHRCSPKTGAKAWLLVDIGTHSTEMICYYGDAAQASASLRVCGDHFTRDLAHALRIPLDAALIVKHEFGGAIPNGVPQNSPWNCRTRNGTV